MRHGTSYGYKERRCRCDECRAWNAAHHAQGRDRREGTALVHGSNSTYVNYKCRCDDCRDAHNVFAANLRANAKRRQPL